MLVKFYNRIMLTQYILMRICHDSLTAIFFYP